MSTRSRILHVVALVLASLVTPSALAATGADFAASWEGKLEVQGQSLRIGFTVKRESGEKYSATMSSPDQGLAAVPVDTVTVDGAKVAFRIAKFGADYEGTLDSAGAKIVGTFRQGGLKVPLDLGRTEQPTEVKRPQMPQPPFPYRTEDVDYDSKNDSIVLGGTLTLPDATKFPPPYAGVVLVTGSGPQDRDESLAGHKPFLVIADWLARNGIATLRADDRGTGSSTGKFELATTFDFCDDALGGVEFLKSRPEIDPKRIGIAGHSEGGLIAPIAATRSADVGFIVMMAGPGVSGRDILIEQIRLISLASGHPAAEVEQEVALNAKMMDLVVAMDVGAGLGAALEAAFEKEKSAVPPLPAWIFEENQKFDSTINTKWFKTFLGYEPQPTIEKVRCPVLVMNGGKDLQVPATQNVPAIEAALKRGGNAHVVTKVYPEMNHLFQPCSTGSPGEYPVIEITFAEEALRDIVAFIAAR